MNNQYRHFGKHLTPSITQELIQELFAGQTVQRQEIIREVEASHLDRGGVASEDPVTITLSTMKESGLAENLEGDIWSIPPETTERTSIKTLNEFMEWAAQFDSRENSKQYLFRGVSSADYKIDASAYRRIKRGRDGDEEQVDDFEKFLQINKDLIRDARFRGHDWKAGRKLEDLEVLAEFQHYGAATFLIDFSYNALVALWFACQENSRNGPKDGKVVAVPPNDPRFTGGTGEFSIITLELIENKIDDFALDNRKLYQWQPRHQNNRIIAQQSIFLFGVLEIEINPDEECIIDAESKETTLESLKQIYGITEDMLFPDFGGFAMQYGQDRSYEELSATQYHQRAYEAYQRGEYEEAIRNYNEVIRITSNDADAYSHRALANNGLERYEAAIDDFTIAIDLRPNDAYNYHHRALANNGLERYEAAIDDFTIAIDLPPNPKSNDVYSYHWRGNVHYVLGQYEEAITDYDAANSFRPNPNAEYSYHWRGLSNSGLERYEAAITDFDEAIRINPDYAEAYYHRADANFSLNHFGEARTDLQTALALANQVNNERLIELIQELLDEINSRI